jgi:hypothetical protein
MMVVVRLAAVRDKTKTVACGGRGDRLFCSSHRFRRSRKTAKGHS